MTNTSVRLFWYFIGLLVFIFLLIKAFSDGDFKFLLEAAKLVAAKENPYNVWICNAALYFYSPLWALLLIPFTYLPNFIPNFIWLLASAIFLYRTWIILNKYIEIQHFTRNEERWLLLLSSILSARFVLYNFELIQMTVFLLWGALESLSLFKSKRYLLGGALLALIINIKILPIVLIPYLIYRKEIKGVGSTLLFGLVFLILPALYLGWSFNLFLLSEWWKVINPGNAEHLLETDLGLHSLTALIPTLLMKTKGVLPYTRNLVNFDSATAINILNGVRIALILLTLWFFKWPPFKRPKSRLNEIHELSYLFLIIPLIFPHQQKYAFYLAYPAFFYISFFLILNFRSQFRIISKTRYFLILVLLSVSFLLMTLSTDGVIGRTLNEITQHYKTITYGAIILIFLLLFSSPDLIEQKKKLNS